MIQKRTGIFALHLRLELVTLCNGSIRRTLRVPPRPGLRSVVLHRSLEVDLSLLQESLHSLLVVLATEHLIDQLAVQ